MEGGENKKTVDRKAKVINNKEVNAQRSNMKIDMYLDSQNLGKG